jgi:hypothetical protein
MLNLNPQAKLQYILRFNLKMENKIGSYWLIILPHFLAGSLKNNIIVVHYCNYTLG